jgi:hypothetical protein
MGGERLPAIPRIGGRVRLRTWCFTLSFRLDLADANAEVGSFVLEHLIERGFYNLAHLARVGAVGALDIEADLEPFHC